jgi:hypothetical protein
VSLLDPRRVNINATLNRRWWREATEIVGSHYVDLTDYERQFFDTCIESQAFEEWHPTVKQFNFMRELARNLR